MPLWQTRLARQAGDLLACEADRAGGRRVHAGDAVEDRALARAVRADQAEDLALVDVERDTFDTAVKPPNVLVRPETVSRATGRVTVGAGSDASRRRRRTAPTGREGSDPRRLTARRRAPAGSGSTGSMVLIAVGQAILVSPLTYCITTGEERSFWPGHLVARREELHAVALDGAAVGNVGLERRLAQRLGIEAAVLLDRARQHVGQEDPGLVEAHRDVRRHLAARRSRPCSA